MTARVRYRRVLALLVILLALFLVWLGAARPYLEALANQENALRAASGQLQLYQRALRGSGAPDTGDKELLQTLLLTGATPAAAAASLQQQAGELTAASGALLLSFELLPASDDILAPLEFVTGRIRLTANTQSLRALLHAVESQRPLLLINALYIRARSDRDTVPGGHLDVQMDIAAARKATP